MADSARQHQLAVAGRPALAARRRGPSAVATALGFLWPGDHGYWLPLTAWIVLRPDFAGTVGRGIERTLATTLGVFLTTLLALVVDDRSMWAAATVAVFAAVAYLVMPVSFFVFSLMVAGFAVFQIDLIDAASIDAAIERGVATLIGGSLAILLYWILPTWQTRRLPDLMGDLIDAYREYASLVLGFQARPTEKDPERLRHVVDEVRLTTIEFDSCRRSGRCGADRRATPLQRKTYST